MAQDARPSYEKGPQPTALLVETIGANLARTVAEHPDRPALISRHQGVRLSYSELDAEVDRIARALIAAGLERGDRLGLWSPNRAEWALIQYATARLGVILVNVNPAYRSHELAYAARQSGCRMLIAARDFKSSDYVAMVEEVRGELDALERVVHFDGPGVGRAPGRRRRRRSRGGRPSARRRWSPTTRSTSSTPAARLAFPRARP